MNDKSHSQFLRTITKLIKKNHGESTLHDMYPAMVAELQSNYTLVFSEEDVEKMVTLAEKVRFRSNAAEVEVHNLEGRIKALEAMKKDKTPRQQAAIDKKNAKVLHAWERYQKAEKEPTTKLHAAQVECGIAITMLCTRRHEYVATKKAEEKTEKMLKKTESKKNKEEAKVKLLAEKQKEKDMEQALKEQEKSLKAQSTKMNDKAACKWFNALRRYRLQYAIENNQS